MSSLTTPRELWICVTDQRLISMADVTVDWKDKTAIGRYDSRTLTNLLHLLLIPSLTSRHDYLEGMMFHRFNLLFDPLRSLLRGKSRAAAKYSRHALGKSWSWGKNKAISSTNGRFSRQDIKHAKGKDAMIHNSFQLGFVVLLTKSSTRRKNALSVTISSVFVGSVLSFRFFSISFSYFMKSLMFILDKHYPWMLEKGNPSNPMKSK